MTSSNEVIALEGAGDRRSPGQFGFRTTYKPKKPIKHYPYFVDPAIVPRVKQYLEDNKDKVYVDMDEMVTELQRKYRDYSKKKRAPFKAVVEKAFSVVLKTYTNETDNPREMSDSSGTDMEVDSEEVDLIVESNTSNDQLINMYKQQQTNKKLTSTNSGVNNDNAKELIDLSSDEEEDEAPAKRPKHSSPISEGEPPVVVPDSVEAEKTSNGHATPDEVQYGEELIVPMSEPVAVSPAPAIPALSGKPKRKRPPADGGPSANNEASKRRKREVAVTHPCCSFKDVGGCTSVLQEVCKLLVHLRHPEIFEQIGVSPPRGFLLHGPPGCGKSLLANAIAGELGLPLLKVAAPELVAGVSGESEERIRDLFDQAASLAPCILFLDEIDAITPNRNNAQREMERRIVAQLLTTLDELGEKEGGSQVLVVGATNRPDALDPALRRAGRFDREVCMGIPDKDARAHILRVVCGRLALAPDVSSDEGIEQLASLTPGFVGADITALTREAAMVAVNRILSKFEEEKSKDTKESESGKSISDLENKEPHEQPSDRTCEAKGKEDSELETSENTPASAVNPEDAPAPNLQAMDTSEEDSPGLLEGKSENVSGESQKEELKRENTETTLVQVNTIEGEIQKEVSPKSELGKLQNENQVIPEAEVEANDTPPASAEDAIVASNVEVKEAGGIEESATETLQNENSRTDDDVEVLEVQVANGSNEPTEANLPSEQIGEASQKEMVLTQKLLPSSVWSPELCQLMSWLKEVPPLTATQLSSLSITMGDFHEALHHIQPSAKREGFATVPDVTWDDIGSLADVRAELQLCVLAPVRYAKQFSQLGLNSPAGVLLCGPPGCGKTLLAKAVANEAGINFISVKGPELLNMYVGESERAVRQVFQRARNSAPCVIFFDELDALCPKRSDSGDNGVSSRVVNQLLTEMDGIEGRTSVFLMAASNRPDIIDPAVLRPGRLDKIVYVGLPNAEDRQDILRALTKDGTRPQLAADVNLTELARNPQLDGYSGADLAALVREAGVHALRDFIGRGEDPAASPLCVSARHFSSAALKIKPSVTGKARKHYERLQEMYSISTTEGRPNAMETA